MTGIKSAIDFFTRYKRCQYEIDPKECWHRECSECECNYDVRTAQKDIETAIRSLQAWEEVLQELEEQLHTGEDSNWKNATINAIDIIKQKLAEIEEVR